jgi:hypothetical protein
VKTSSNNSGVDLAREERLKKCEVIIDYYDKIRVSNNIDKIIKKQNNDDVLCYNLALQSSFYICLRIRPLLKVL